VTAPAAAAGQAAAYLRQPGTRVDFVTINGEQVAIRETPDNGGDRHYPYPWIPGLKLVSVTSVLGDTTGKAFLNRWYGKMGAKAVLDNLDVYAQVIAEHGMDAAYELAAGEGERIRSLKADLGSYVHALVENLILSCAVPDGVAGSQIALPDMPPHLAKAEYEEGVPVASTIDPETGKVITPGMADWMITGFLNFVSAWNARFMAAEMVVYDVDEGVAGTLDIILGIENVAISHGTGPRGEDELVPCPGGLVVLCVDVKTGKTYESAWKDQIAKYRRMKEALMPDGTLIPMLATDAAAVLHLRPDYDGGYRLMLVSGADDAAGAARFEKARTLRLDREQASDKPGAVIYPLNPDGTMPPRRVADLDGCGYPRAVPAVVKALGTTVTVADLAIFTRTEILTVKGIGPATVLVLDRMLTDHHLSWVPEPETVPVLAHAPAGMPADQQKAA
jgi:hypothetical protein